jgi:choline dehydrogenase
VNAAAREPTDVVGSGAGGGPVAANLAEAGYTVVLLEAGLDPEDDDYRVPAFHGRASEHPGMSWPFFVRHFDDQAQQERDEKYRSEHDGVLYPRSGTLGGCTAHNAMITIYPHDADWDGIARATGDRTWRATQMRRWFEQLEACAPTYKRRPRALPRNRWLAGFLSWLPLVSDKYVNRNRHGFDGWLHTTLADPALALGDKQVLSVLKAAAAGSLANFLNRPLTPFEGLTSAVDPNDWRGRRLPEGLWLIPIAVRNGKRATARVNGSATSPSGCPST